MPQFSAPNTNVPTDRRRNIRFLLGLPVRVHFAGVSDPITAELVDVSLEGGRFRSLHQTARLNQHAAIVFVLPGQRRCLAKGRVVRTDVSGEFALCLDKANDAFRGFVGDFST